MSPSHTNNLINETSPYLLQHAHNPVNWYPWGEIALQKAKEMNKPILVSIGYSACHWCHVMERESFEDEVAAQIMNDNFINIKIDREERPDLDHIYMDAVQAMLGSGGWPLNVFLTPDTKPFYGGTYFPPVKAFNRSSWKEVLLSISEAWEERRNEIESHADNLIAYLQQSNSFGQTKNIQLQSLEDSISKELCYNIFQTIMKTADKECGGFGNAPKFPQTFTIQYLIQYYHFTDNVEALQQALLSIDKMLQGGIYDHVAGGLARYSTDSEWLAPHFEKMLYDNALLVSVLCDAYQVTKNKYYEKAIRKTIGFIQQELTNPSGGFYAALDADSEGEEGKYYVWQKKEIDDILDNDTQIFCKYFDITEKGNWEGKNILRILKPLDDFVKENNLSKDEFEKIITLSLQKLERQRNKRIKPQLDDKIILSWNALMIKALCKAAMALKDNEYKKMAEENFGFIESNFKSEIQSSALWHNYKNGIAKTPAFLDDYAYLIDACICLYEITFNTTYLDKAHSYCQYVIKNFSDEDSPFFFFTSVKQKDIPIRKKEIYDGAIPSGNAIMANNLLKLSIIYNKMVWQQKAEAMLEELFPVIEKHPGSFGIWASFLLKELLGINEITIMGDNYKVIGTEILSQYIPNKIIMGSALHDSNFPMLEKKISSSDTLIYLCKNYTCIEPLNTAQDLLTKVSAMNKI
jgi:uncharacterized protein YyaL (SSP411 family)